MRHNLTIGTDQRNVVNLQEVVDNSNESASASKSSTRGCKRKGVAKDAEPKSKKKRTTARKGQLNYFVGLCRYNVYFSVA